MDLGWIDGSDSIELVSILLNLSIQTIPYFYLKSKNTDKASTTSNNLFFRGLYLLFLTCVYLKK